MKKICSIDVIEENSSRGFKIGDKNIFIIKKSGNFYGYLNQCPHRFIPLEWTPNDFLDETRNLIRCSSHGALFEINTGECIKGPCLGDRLAALKLIFKDEFIWIQE